MAVTTNQSTRASTANGRMIMIWRFMLHLKDLEEFTDALVDAIYEAGCSDGTLVSSNYRCHIGFSREAPSLSTAIRSAVADVRSVGLDVDGVEIERQDLAEAYLAQW